MSRAERRAYKRMTKNTDPYALPPAAAQRVKSQQRQRGRRPATHAGDAFRFVTGRFLVLALGGAALVALAAFSIAWPSGMPFALYAGLGAGVAWIGLSWLLRWLQARVAARR